MTENEIKGLIDLRGTILDSFTEGKKVFDSEEFKALDGLNKDLLVLQLNAAQVLAGVLNVRIGLNISQVQKAVQNTDKASVEKSVENEVSTPEESKPEQPVA